MSTSFSEPPVFGTLPVVLWLVFCVTVLAAVSVGAFYWAPAAEHYTITERYLFTSTGDDARVFLSILLPKSGPYQEVKLASVYWQGSVSSSDEQDVNVVKLAGDLQGDGRQEAVIEYDVTLRQGSFSWEAAVTESQVRPQWNIESNHPEIMRAAKRIADGSARQVAYRFYEFASQSLSWPEEEPQFIDASALRAYQTGKGSCGDRANLMVALCRAAGIPSQTIIGIIFPDLPPYSTAAVRSLSHPGESHAWVEFSTNSRWEMADPSRTSNSPLTTGFGFNDGRHLSYGEAGQLSEVYASAQEWSTSHGSLVGSRFASLKFIAAADGDGILVTPRVTMKKGWDGRWFNMLSSWLITLILLYWVNRRKVAAHDPSRLLYQLSQRLVQTAGPPPGLTAPI